MLGFFMDWTPSEHKIISNIAYRNYKDRIRLGFFGFDEQDKQFLKELDWALAETEFRTLYQNQLKPHDPGGSFGFEGAHVHYDDR